MPTTGDPVNAKSPGRCTDGGGLFLVELADELEPLG
jgi:hypothetical protein